MKTEEQIITITSPVDIKICEQHEECNDHQTVREIATHYTTDQDYKTIVDRLIVLTANAGYLSMREEDERQDLIRQANQYTIRYKS